MSRNSDRRKRAREDGKLRALEGYASPHPEEWKDEHAAYAEGFKEGSAELEVSETERIWRAVILEPLAKNFDATPEVMEELIDVIVAVIHRGKTL